MTDYLWRGHFTDSEVNALHADAFRTRVFPDVEWPWNRLVADHSLGWVVARDGEALVGFVNVIWDGLVHAWVQDTMVSADAGRRGIGTQLVAVARDKARAAGCEYLHVDFDPDLDPFYIAACGFDRTPAGVMRLVADAGAAEESETGAAVPADSARQFGWWDMFVHPDEDPRADGGFVGEREILVGYLRDRRLTLELKCAGLDAEQMARRSVEPSNLSLLGLVRHLADVERGWFRKRLAGQDAPPHFLSKADPNGDFDGAVPDAEIVAQAWEAWRTEVAFADQFVADAPDLALVGKDGDVLREVLVHMIEEYARHNGHADFLRERIDGRVGQ